MFPNGLINKMCRIYMNDRNEVTGKVLRITGGWVEMATNLEEPLIPDAYINIAQITYVLKITSETEDYYGIF